MNDLKEMVWEIRIPIFKNSLILRQLMFAIGIPFGTLLMYLIYIKGYYGALLVALTLLLTFIFIQVVYGGTYDVKYIMNKKGVRCAYQEKQRKKNNIINTLLFFSGIFSGKPTYAGAGVLANARQDEFIAWKKVIKIKYFDHKRIIVVKSGYLDHITIFCENDDYDKIKTFVKNNTKIS
ncbi:hypothetical protein [Cellulosilyticum sp. I15G10I2]|uniref:hypothetical protein n=1 Tax=Cellulosilyticum sp. I15G10I2 TaxID=1892843 RepID=UPI00085CB45D|nr:hypothetical protein [Cellulosilyticum sp. I15G10I2]